LVKYKHETLIFLETIDNPRINFQNHLKIIE
jgi:hypothetical protein